FFGLHFAKSLAKIGFQLIVSYLSAKRIEQFCKPRLRKFFHGLAEAPHVITDNEGCYAPMTLVSLLNSAVMRAKASCDTVLRAAFVTTDVAPTTFFIPFVWDFNSALILIRRITVFAEPCHSAVRFRQQSALSA